MATIKEIAQRAGVSTTTVSNVIHGKTKKVSPANIQKIENLIREMGYVQKMGLRVLNKEKSQLIAVVINHHKDFKDSVIGDPFYGKIIGFIEKYVQELGYYLMLYSAKDTDKIFQMVMGWDVDGVIAISFSKSNCEKIYQLINKPIVSIDAYGELDAGQENHVLNIGLDLLFVAVLPWGIAGAAFATVIAQYVSGIGITIYVLHSCKDLLPGKEELCFDRGILGEIVNLSSLTCLQQSVMNFGILMVQGLVNSFGATVMAAFAAAVKIDTFAYLPVQDFGNAFSTFVAQNYGAGNQERIRKGTRVAFAMSIGFSVMISVLVCLFAGPLMKIFVSGKEVAVIAAGVKYLRIEGAFYLGIGCLFLLYGYYRAIKRAEMSVVLTVISLGLRVLLAYVLSVVFGEVGIWVAIPIGWVMADVTGIVYMRRTW